MENASKALIIAGAILISILLIGVGMMVYQGAQGGIESAISQMSAQEKEMFNSSFTNYTGDKVTGANVRALISNIISNNSANQDIEGKLVELDISGAGISGVTITQPAEGNVDAAANTMSAARAKINTGSTYQVNVEYSTSGLVNKVIITKNS